MYILCYECYADVDTKEIIWLSAEWATALPCGGIRYYIREDRTAIPLLADPNLHRKPKFDYIL